MNGRRHADGPQPNSARVDWTRVTLAVKYVESALHARFKGDGLVRGPQHRGWLRNRLRELLESFPTAEGAQTWVRAASFKAKGKDRPMAYFVRLVCKAATDPELRNVPRLLSNAELVAFGRNADRQGNPRRRGPETTA